MEAGEVTKSISIVIPTLNEEGNIRALIERIHNNLISHGICYEIIVIDDHSSDNTKQIVETFPASINGNEIIFQEKQGERGKAFSLIQGFKSAKYDIVGFIDADLQYPPEALSGMFNSVYSQEYDVIVANRDEKRLSLKRRLPSTIFRVLFGKFLHNFDCDIQSGLKVFRKEILDRAVLKPSKWTFDLDFLIAARNGGYKIGSTVIEFQPRIYGEEKVKIIRSSIEIAKAAIKSKISAQNIVKFTSLMESQNGHGFHHRGKKYVTHSTLHHSQSAVNRISRIQQIILVLILIISIIFSFINLYSVVLVIVTIMTLLYFTDLLFNLFLIYKSFFYPVEIKVTEDEIQRYNKEWPLYSIFCPLYKEAHVLPQFVTAISQLDYPKNKLDVMLVLEENDPDTIKAAQEMGLPDYIRIVVVPHSIPKTKPKACNYALQQAKGEFVVIYDAEDIPDIDQLKKAVMAFQKSERNIFCIQAKLNYYNPTQNILTRLFTSEYSLWFDLILTGLQSVNAPIPLGGTSNHFRREDLLKLEGWDPFNVTEDADLGMRIVKRGYRTAILDSTTMEEANSQYKNWFKQRSRWIKGYIQTYFVHMRNPYEYIKTGNFYSLITFQLIVGGKILSMLINPLMWMITLSYFIFRPFTGKFIESLYQGPVYYIALFTLVIGNLLYIYYYMIGVAKREQWGLVLFSFLTPFYWAMISISAYYALWEFIVRPFHWNKTKHGLHLLKDKNRVGADLLINTKTQIL